MLKWYVVEIGSRQEVDEVFDAEGLDGRLDGSIGCRVEDPGPTRSDLVHEGWRPRHVDWWKRRTVGKAKHATNLVVLSLLIVFVGGHVPVVDDIAVPEVEVGEQQA